MLIRKLLCRGTSKVNPATYPAVSRCFSAACSPSMTLTCKPTLHGQYSEENLGQQSRLNSRIQHEIRRAQSTHSNLLEAVGQDLLEEEKEEVEKLTSRFLHTGGMAHQVDHVHTIVVDTNS